MNLFDCQKSLWKQKFFWIILAAKIFCSFFFASDFLTELFLPFIDAFAQHPLDNPWNSFHPKHFPYGSFLLIVIALPKMLLFPLFGSAVLGTTALSLFLVRLPLLLFDVLLLQQFSKICHKQFRRILIYYWANPILFYISYIHGQFDVAAICLLTFSILLFIQNRHAVSGLVFGLAILCKFHVVLAIPVFLIFEWKKKFPLESLRSLGLWLLPLLAVAGLGFLPHFYAGTMLYSSVASPEALRIFAAKIEYANLHLLLGLAGIILFYGRLLISNRIGSAGLLHATAVLFGILLLSVVPMPGWYFWTLPFIALFYSINSRANRSLLIALHLAYFLYFYRGVIAQWIPVFSDELAFTLLQTTLAGALFVYWNYFVQNYSGLSSTSDTHILSIAGDSGVGKTTFSELALDVLGSANTTLIQGDNYHRWERRSPNWNSMTHLNPQANDFDSLIIHASEFQRGNLVSHQKYDHNTGEFLREVVYEPKRFVIMEGLHSLYSRSLRQGAALKIFLSPTEEIRKEWKVQRDVHQRGGTLSKVEETIERRQDDREQHILPQNSYADWTLHAYKNAQGDISFKHFFWNDAPLFGLIKKLKEVPSLDIKVEFSKPDVDHLQIEVSGSISALEVQKIAGDLFASIRTITQGFTMPLWRANAEGIAQLMLLILLRDKIFGRAT